MFRKTLGMLAMAACAVCAFAEPKYQSEMTVSGYSGATTLENFPVLVRISEARIEGFDYDDCASDGSDISFAADSEGLNVLSFEVDTWNPAGESLVWVKLPTLSGKETKFYFRWNDADPAPNDPTAVWPNYMAVWHMGDGGNAKNSSPKGAAMNAVETVAGCSTSAEGKVGASTVLSGGKLTVPNSGHFYGAGRTFSISGWFYSQNTSQYTSLMAKDGTWSTCGWYLFYNTKGGLYFSSKGSDVFIKPCSVLSGWTYITISSDDGAVTYLQNGVKSVTTGKAAAGKLVNDACDISVCCPGWSDEIRISSGTTSDDWSLADYETMTKANYIVAGSREVRVANGIQVTGHPENLFANQVAYGWTKGCVSGTDYTFTCIEGGYVDETEKKRSLCTGWKLYDMDGNLERSSSDAGETPLSCTVRYAHAVRLEWQWSTQVRFDFTCSDNGTVKGGLTQWFAYGSSVTLEAQPGTDSHFLRWSGDTLGLEGLENANLTVPNVLEPRSLSAAFWREFHPTPGTDIAAVAELLTNECDTAYLAAGTYPWTESVALDRPVRIIGAGMDKTIISGGASTYGLGSAISLTSDGAEVSDLTVKQISGRAFGLSKGRITRCRMLECRATTTSGGRATGAGVNQSGGLLADSVITNCALKSTYCQGAGLHLTGGIASNLLVCCNNVSGSSSANSFGIGVGMVGGLLTHSVIRDNGNVSAGSYGGGVGIRMANVTTVATVRNCLIMNNVGYSKGMGIMIDRVDGEAIVESCTVAANGSSDTSSEVYNTSNKTTLRNNVIWNAQGGTDLTYDNVKSLTYCRYKEATGANNNTSAEPHFRNPTSGNYRLTSASTGLIGSGSVQSWMTGAADLKGNPRLNREGRVDMGCYSYLPKGLMIMFR